MEGRHQHHDYEDITIVLTITKIAQPYSDERFLALPSIQKNTMKDTSSMWL